MADPRDQVSADTAPALVLHWESSHPQVALRGHERGRNVRLLSIQGGGEYHLLASSFPIEHFPLGSPLGELSRM